MWGENFWNIKGRGHQSEISKKISIERRLHLEHNGLKTTSHKDAIPCSSTRKRRQDWPLWYQDRGAYWKAITCSFAFYFSSGCSINGELNLEMLHVLSIRCTTFLFSFRAQGHEDGFEEISQRNEVTMSFSSDGEFQDEGFKMTFRAIKDPSSRCISG